MTREMKLLVGKVVKKVKEENLNQLQAESYLRKRLLAAQKDSLSKADYGRLIRLVVSCLSSEIANLHHFTLIINEDFNREKTFIDIVTYHGARAQLTYIPNTQEGLFDVINAQYVVIDGYFHIELPKCAVLV